MKILERILYYGLLLSLFTPLVANEGLVYPFITTKVYFFYIIITVLFISYLLILNKKQLYPKKSKLLFIFLGITLLTFILDLFGIGFKNSFWGNYERMTSIYTSIYFLIYLWILLSIFNTKEKYLKLINISVIVSFLVSIYGILQKFNVKFSWIINTEDNRISATLGNPAFLAGFLLLFLFIIIYLFINNKNKYWRIFYLITFILNFSVLLSTATRGALVGLVFALFFMLFYLILFYKNRKIKIISSTLLLLLILSTSFIFIFKDSYLIQNNLALRRISEISLKDTTTISRLMLWKMSINASKESPVVGYGFNNIRVPLDKYHDYNLREDWFDSSHNKFLDELLSHGIIGFVLQILFFIYLFILIFKLKKKEFINSLILFGLLVAYVTQAMFIFDSFIISWLLVLIIGFLIVNNYKDEDLVFRKRISLYFIIPLIIFIIYSFSFLYSHSISPARDIISGYGSLNTNLNTTIDLHKSANEKLFFNYDIFAPSMAKAFVFIFDNADKYTDVQIKKYIDLMTSVYNKAIKDSGNYSKFYVNLAKVYQTASRLPRFDYLDQSMELLYTALEYSPNRIDIYYALAQGYYLKNDIEKSEETLHNSLNLGVRHADIYLKLAQVQAKKGDPEKAIISINKSEELGKVFQFNDLEDFAITFINRNKFELAIEVFLKMDILQPYNINTYSNIALAYSKIGEKEKAIEWMSKILEINPTMQDSVDEFINSL